ncbi:MAG: YfhO family protein [Thermoanaerobaculales bacterium]|nr:YfhO family protein [Thermoanaerobaculales bacterium]
MSREPRPILLAALLGLFALAFFHPVVAGRPFVHMDFHQTFEPQQACVRAAVARGSVSWNPLLSNGVPLLANPIYAAFYPPRWAIVPLSPAFGLTVLGAAHVLWGGLGAMLLARRYGLGGAPALTAGLAFGFSGLAISATAPCAYGWTLAWAPWLVLAFEAVLTAERGGRAVVALALSTFFILVAGEPFVIVGALAGMAARLALAFPDEASAGRGRGSVRTVLGLAIGGAAALPHILASSRLFASSVRASGFETAGSLQWSMHPLELTGLVVSDPFGDPTTYGPTAFWGQELVAPRAHFLFQGSYVGALVVVLAIVGLSRRGRLRLALAAWFGALLLMALGRYGPVYPLLIAIDETLVDSIRYPVKWLVPAMLPLALLAALGVARIREASDRRGPAAVALLGLVGLALVSAALPLGLDRWLAGLSGVVTAEQTQAVRDLLLGRVALAAAPLLVAALALLAAIRGSVDPRRVAALLPLIVGADLWLNNRHLAPTVEPAFYSEPPAVVRAILADDRVGRVMTLAEVDRVPWPSGVDGDARDYYRWERQTLRLLTGASYGLALAFNPDMEAFSTLRSTQLSVLVNDAPLREKMMLAGAAGVTHVVSTRPVEGPQVTPIPLPPGTPVHLVRNRLAQPRVRVVPELSPYDGFDGLIRLVVEAPDDLFARSALVESATLASIAPAPGTGPGTARIVSDSGDELVVRTGGGGGILVVSDTYTPGWRATVDGEAAAIFPVDVAFRGIAVPPGDREVVLGYSPWR